MIRMPERIKQWVEDNNIVVLDSLPDGWKRVKTAMTAPRGYYWASNGGNPFIKGDYKHALIKESWADLESG